MLGLYHPAPCPHLFGTVDGEPGHQPTLEGVRVFVFVCACVCAYACVCMSVRVGVWVCVRVRVQYSCVLLTCLPMHAHTCTHAHTHAHTQHTHTSAHAHTRTTERMYTQGSWCERLLKSMYYVTQRHGPAFPFEIERLWSTLAGTDMCVYVCSCVYVCVKVVVRMCI